MIFLLGKVALGRSQWLRGLRRRSSVARLLRLWVRIPLGAWMSVCCECCVLSGRGLCDELISRPEESYRLRCVKCDLETSCMRRPWPTGELSCQIKEEVTLGQVVSVYFGFPLSTSFHQCSILIFIYMLR